MDILKYIIIGLLGLLEAIGVLAGVIAYPKNKKLDMISKKEYALQLMPSAIKVAESSKESGPLKKDFVIASLVTATENKFGQFKDKDKINFIEYLNTSLESTLETPQKKEVIKNG